MNNDIRLIAHRGNLIGKNPEMENRPDYINEALDKGYYAEADLWYLKGNGFYLGHDKPQYKIDASFLSKSKVFFHCKDGVTLKEMSLRFTNRSHFFVLDKDNMTITNQGIIWGTDVESDIFVDIGLRKLQDIHKKYFGICSDYVGVINDYLHS